MKGRFNLQLLLMGGLGSAATLKHSRPFLCGDLAKLIKLAFSLSSTVGRLANVTSIECRNGSSRQTKTQLQIQITMEHLHSEGERRFLSAARQTRVRRSSEAPVDSRLLPRQIHRLTGARFID